jgi:hypothetical protein
MNSYNNGTNGAQEIVQFMALHNLNLAWNKAFGGENEVETGAGKLKALVVLLVCAVPVALIVIPAIAFTF